MANVVIKVESSKDDWYRSLEIVVLTLPINYDLFKILRHNSIIKNHNKWSKNIAVNK